jgi:cob(I)alamin adenosyltransferase
MASWFEFLRLEADLAMTFIGTARIHSNPANAARSLRNARKALAEIQRGLLNPAGRRLSEDEVLVLKQRCVKIESELATF